MDNDAKNNDLTPTTEGSGDAMYDALFERSEYSHFQAEKISYSNYSYWRSTLKTFFKNKVAVFLMVVLVALILFSIIQPYLPNQQSIEKTLYLSDTSMWKAPPSSTHWFGTDAMGRDMWVRVWAGVRISLSLAAIVAVAEILLGVIIGAIWGYVRKMDRFMTELYNIIANVPQLVLYVLIAYILTPSYWTMIFVMVAANWIYMARFVRNMVLMIRDREYNLASRSLGTPTRRMLFKNVIPYLVSVIIMRLAETIPGVIAAEVTLTYLNVGLPATWPSLGVLINTGARLFPSFLHLLIYPCIGAAVITISFYVIGNAFSDASDPRNHM